MNKLELIKRLVEAETETLPMGFEDDPMGFILKKYPGLNNVMEYMMTKEFREFVDAIFVVAPKPTTFKVLLHNGQYFFLQFMGDTYQATVLGKNYYLKSIGEKERCMLAIARLLRYGQPLKTKGPEGGETGAGEEAGGLGGETTPTETGGEETGGAEAGGEALEESKIVELLLRESIMEAPKKKKDEEEEDQSEYIQSLFKNYEPTGIEYKNGDYYVSLGVVKSTGADSRSQRVEISNALAKTKTNVKAGKDKKGSPLVNVTRGGRTYKVYIKGYTEGASTTNDKEGLTILFCYSDITEPVTKENFREVVKKLRALIKPNLSRLGGVKDKEGKVDIQRYFDKIQDSDNVIETLNQSLSQALPIKKSYPGKNVTRSGLFNQYKALAARVFKPLPADKWCPADLFILVDDAAAQTTYDAAEAMTKNPDFDELEFMELINGVFNNKFGNVDKPITGVSLKYEQAQLGKAKSYLDREFEDVEDTYNVTEKEQRLPQKQKLAIIDDYRKNIQSILKKRTEKSPQIIYSIKDKTVEKGKIDGKFAGLKAINFFFNQIYPNKIDNALLDLTKFALSLTTLNPTFFKIKAVGGGQPGTVKEFSQGVSVTLKKNQPITIIDDPGYKGVKIMLPIKRTESDGSIENTTIQISAKSNGNTQGTIELEQR